MPRKANMPYRPPYRKRRTTGRGGAPRKMRPRYGPKKLSYSKRFTRGK